MVDITLDGDRVRFEVQGWDKLWALKSELSIPLSHVRGVRIDPEDLDHEHYKRMVIEVADPPAAVKLLEGAQRSAGAAR